MPAVIPITAVGNLTVSTTLTSSALGNTTSDYALFVMTGHDPADVVESANLGLSFGILRSGPTSGTAGGQAAGRTQMSVFPLISDGNKTYCRSDSTPPGTGGLTSSAQVTKNWVGQVSSVLGVTNAGGLFIEAQDDPTNAFIPNGVKLVIGNEPAMDGGNISAATSTMLGFAVLCGQWGCSHLHANVIDLGNGTTPITVTMDPDQLIGEPDIVYFFGPGGPVSEGTPPVPPGNSNYFAGMFIGVAVNDGGGNITQRAVSWMEGNGSSGAPYQYLATDASIIMNSPTSSSLLYKAGISSFASNQFTITPISTDGILREVSFLAIKLHSASKKLFTLSAPASTGNTSYTDPGFTPALCVVVGTGLTSTDVSGNGTTAGGLGISAFTATTAEAACGRMSATSSASASFSAHKAIQWADGASVSKVIATLKSMDTNGFTLNYSATTSGAKGFCLAIGAEAACGNNFPIAGNCVTDNEIQANYKRGVAAPNIISDGGGSTATISVASGTTPVTTVIATGTTPITYLISGGANAGLFTINATTGVLALASVEPAGNYVVAVTASNWLGSDTQTITAAVQPAATAHGVNFNGTASLLNNSLTQTDSPDFSFFFWMKSSVGHAYIWSSNPSQFNNWFFINNGTFEGSFGDTLGNNSIAVENNGSIPNITDGNWHWFLMSGNLNFGFPNKLVQVLVDGVDCTDKFSDSGAATNLQLNGLPFYMGQDGFGDPMTMDIAQFWYAPINLLNGSNVIPLATQQQFVNGGLSQPSSGFPAGAVILFDGDHTTFGNNHGTGGSFSLTGTLTNSSTNPP